MNSIKTFVSAFSKDQSGAAGIEYGLLAGLIAVAIIVAVGNVGTTLDGVFDKVDTELKKVNPAPAG